ncbi:aminoacyl-histidine dipeptidase [Porphyromonas circumdentaria]|uniref:Cytosol non-specific dipeptidase n=1 Tax=Porphyromonas circumdentaria TaxID=29524 RepID=A0A1T4PBI6_9PORP|nr:aminoacyl-histidine dipeptidase [Porphyromonas circumdentaria]MBB6276362.1 dipeptidase D [Porphyromonas circumdentaria]MDO4722858.1 aminoacyl-histidine dipeptidase [Porphyromonas circumdentaria]SJZ88741.1 dipeptidase D [Porphyromonas circumdentaria]
MNITDLKPELVWRYFHEITQVPRPSKKEEKILAYLKKFAEDRKLDYSQDEAGNIVIRKAATPGYENLKTVVLQSHVDMVCEKNNDTVHNFDTDPIRTVIDGEWVRAEGTTLGADNGIGVAAELALLDDDSLEHGPIECLFTVDEETGLTGAMNLAPGFIKGTILLNLDSEDEGEMFIGCAGGMGTTATFNYTTEATPADYFYGKINVSGLKGGHSGGDIHVGLGSANKILNRALYAIREKMPLVLAQIDGGNLHNAIAREAMALIGVPMNRKEELAILINELDADVRTELEVVDPNVKVTLSSVENPTRIIDRDTTQRLISALYACPHGVMGMSHAIEGLVETSTNLASIKMKENNKIVVETSQRSSSESLKADVGNTVKSVFDLAGAEVEVRDGYPGWSPNPNSPILQVTIDAYKKLFGKEPAVKAIHAGLECGLFLSKYPYLDMVSFGPTLRDVHSPVERMEIATVDLFWRHLLEVLKNIPKA